MSIETLLHSEIKSEFETLSRMEVGTEEHGKTVETITVLVDRAIEMEKLNIEEQEKDEEKKDRLIKNVLAGLGIAIPSLITIWGTCKSIKFEETGTITTIMGRGFINKLLPKK